LRVFNIFFSIGAVPVLAPLPDVAMHVKQAPGVGREAAHRRGLLPVNALLALAVKARAKKPHDNPGNICRRRFWQSLVGVIAVVVGLVGRDRLAEVERCRRPCTAGVFPLRLGRQTEPLSRLLTQLFDELLAIIPGYALDGKRLALENAGV